MIPCSSYIDILIIQLPVIVFALSELEAGAIDLQKTVVGQLTKYTFIIIKW